MPVATLALSGRQHAALRQHLFPGDGREAVAFALCGRHRGANDEDLLAQEIVLIPHAACSVRTPDRVTWPTGLLPEYFDRAHRRGLGFVKVHGHPNGYPGFSGVDDEADRALFPSIHAWIDDGGPHGSAVMMPNGRLIGRVVTEAAEFVPFRRIRVAGDNLHFWDAAPDVARAPDPHAIRLVQTFGEATYALLRRLRIGIVGCSGTGSLVAEQLARNCVGELVLVDPKPVEDRNLNRIPQATKADADQKSPKVDVLRRAIEAMGLSTRVTTYPTTLHDPHVLRDLARCDIVFGCMDTVDGRDSLNRLATYYLIPYFDVGVKLVADGTGGIETIVGTVHYLQPGGSSLLSRGVYTPRQLEAAQLLRRDPAEYEARKKDGYIDGVVVDRPAVISVNMLYASLAVNELLARLHPFRVDGNGGYAIHRLAFSHGAYCTEQDGDPCPTLARHAGKGDVEPFLGLWEYAEVPG